MSFRLRISGLDERASGGPGSLRFAAWAGLQDSMPRAAVLSLHARIAGVRAQVLDDPSLIQVWGPRYSVYVAAAEDRAVFTLSRWPEGERARDRATRMAARLAAHLDGRREAYDDVGDALGINPNALRYATVTGTVLIRWEGVRRPLVSTVPAPEIDVVDARAELVRRYLHVFGPATRIGFGPGSMTLSRKPRLRQSPTSCWLPGLRWARLGSWRLTRRRSERSPGRSRRRGCCPAETRSTCTGARTGACWCPMQPPRPNCGLHVCGPAVCFLAVSWPAPGAAPRRRSACICGSSQPAPSVTRSRKRPRDSQFQGAKGRIRVMWD